MNSTKRRWWQKMAEKSPSWRGFRKTWFHRWAGATLAMPIWSKDVLNDLSIWILFVLFFSGNCEARPPLYSCRFPRRPLWGVKSCTDALIYHEVQPQVLVSEQSLVPSTTVETGTVVWREQIQTVILNWYIEWNVIHLNSTMVRGCPVHKNPYFDIHRSSDGTGCVSTTQLICKQS